MSHRAWAGLLVVVLIGSGASWHRAKAQEGHMSCAWVAHVHQPADGSDMQFVASPGADGQSYAVDYRVHEIKTDATGPWTKPMEASLDGNAAGTTVFRYVTRNLEPEEYDYVEWRVTTTWHKGFNVAQGKEMVAYDGVQNNFTILSDDTCGVESINFWGVYVIYTTEHWVRFLPSLGAP